MDFIYGTLLNTSELLQLFVCTDYPASVCALKGEEGVGTVVVSANYTISVKRQKLVGTVHLNNVTWVILECKKYQSNPFREGFKFCVMIGGAVASVTQEVPAGNCKEKMRWMAYSFPVPLFSRVLE